MLYNYYLELLNYKNMPDFLNKYLNTPSLLRLKKIGYFCGMDYASKDIYDFKEKISRFDHSLSTALLTWKLTNNKKATLAALFHDVSTPCFSHVIDYMNKDYEKQESTEVYTEQILKSDNYLHKCLLDDEINIDEIIDFKKYSIVDNNRPKLCADRLDGIILTGISWTKNIEKEDINSIIKNICVFKNEDNEDEIGFSNIEIAKKVLEISKSIDIYCHSKEDNYMMNLLADITKLAINKKYITYKDLYTYNEDELLTLFNTIKDLNKYMYKFENIKLSDIPEMEIPKIKQRKLNPLVNNKRLI